LAFSTANQVRSDFEAQSPIEHAELLRDDQLSPLFQAVRDATEEAVINSILQAVTTAGLHGHTVDAIDAKQVLDICRKMITRDAVPDLSQPSSSPAPPKP
jgi:D-aminopeptidase